MQNPRLNGLTDYFFRRLAALLEPLAPASGYEPIDLSIGQPMHPTPDLLTETLAANGHLWRRYPPVLGTAAFRDAVCAWLTKRYNLPADMVMADQHVLPVAGTKEALFMVSQLVAPEAKAGAKPAVLMPNPFYNVYLGGALVAGAEPVLLPVSAETNHLPDLDRLDAALLDRTVAFFLCSPANPQGSAADQAYLAKALRMARQHDFLLVLDECYSEIYTQAPPTGGLEAAAALGDGLRQSSRLPLPFQTLQCGGIALGLCRWRCQGDQRLYPSPQLCSRGSASAGAGGGRRTLARRRSC